MAEIEDKVVVVIDGVEVEFDTMPRHTFYEANKRIEEKMLKVVETYRNSIIATKESLNKLTLNA